MRNQQIDSTAAGARRLLPLYAGLCAMTWTTSCMVETGGETGEDQLVEIQSQATTSFFKNLVLVVRNCRHVTADFERVTTFNGRAVVRYRLWRNGEVVNTVTPDPDRSPSSHVTVGDGWFFPEDGTNRYQVEVENDRGEKEKSATLTYTPTGCASLRQEFVIVKLTPSDLDPYSEIAEDGKIKTRFGTTTSNKSVRSFFNESSYRTLGLTYVEKSGWLDIGMTHADFCGGSSNVSTDESGRKSCASGRAKTRDARAAFEAEIARDYPNKPVVWIYNGMSGASAVYNSHIVSGAVDVARGDLRAIFHETGHYFGLTEGWGLRCPTSSGWFGPALTGIPGPTPPSGCYFAQYAYKYDPMAGQSGHDFYAMHKYQMGWLKRINVAHQSFISTGRQVTMTLKAVDHPTLSTGSDLRFGRYQLEANGSGYFLFEYRRNAGNSAVIYEGQTPLEEGIYMTYFAGKNPTTNTKEDSATSGDHGDLLVPYRQNTDREPRITSSSPYIDPDRQLRVTLESIDTTNKKATIKIHKAYAYTGTCVATIDNANYVSAGYPCFCSRAVGAFVNKTSTTVECKAGTTPTR